MAPSLEQEAASVQLSVLESFLVAPSSPPALGAATSLPLTFIDVYWLPCPPVERVFFYRLTSGTHDTTSILSNLRTSLSRALQVFYPLAGRLRVTPGTDDRYEIHCQPGDAVAFTVAEYDADIDELAADEPREVARLLPLAPPLADGGALLAVQATVLRGGRGLAVGVTVSHAVCDGASSALFLRTWAAFGTGACGPLAPVIDRSLLSGGRRRMYDLGRPDSGETEDVKTADVQLLATFTLSKQDIQRVKDVVIAAGAPRCTSLVATFGLVWSCHERAKDDSASNSGGSSKKTYFLFPVDHRARMKPGPIPEEYFGNCIAPVIHAAPKAQVAAAGAVGLVAACTAVAAAVEKAVGDGGIGSPDQWFESLREAGFFGGGVLSVAGSPRFRVYDVDFGFGRPAKVEIVSVARTGAMAVAESHRSGGGGMEVGMSMPPAVMDRFRACFNDTITWLHQH